MPKVDNSELEYLVESARGAANHAYCPYSKFRVGAAVIAERPRPPNGIPGPVERATFSGCNTENANYSLTLHAEHSAVSKAVELGYTAILAVAVYTPTEEATAPCGSCRQVLNEFGPEALVVCVCDNPRSSLRASLSKLLPDAFGPHNLGKS
jgi:cytidine deaminase